MVSPTNQATSTVRQYRMQIFDPDSIVTVTSTSLEDIKSKARRLLDTAPRFEKSGQNTQQIYADAHLGGQRPCGVVWEQEVPEEFSVQHVTETRIEKQQAA